MASVAELAGGYARGLREVFAETDTGALLGGPTNLPCQKGAWTTKRNNRHDLQSSTPGTVSQWYCDVALDGDTPTGPFKLAGVTLIGWVKVHSFPRKVPGIKPCENTPGWVPKKFSTPFSMPSPSGSSFKPVLLPTAGYDTARAMTRLSTVGDCVEIQAVAGSRHESHLTGRSRRR